MTCQLCGNSLIDGHRHSWLFKLYVRTVIDPMVRLELRLRRR
ncbi:hypothetical protein [Mycobacterium sp. 1274761.0]|nr:hypothetical protein [Mycobacterium sp. 1274761.0]